VVTAQASDINEDYLNQLRDELAAVGAPSEVR
jgi:hypothetical protein